MVVYALLMRKNAWISNPVIIMPVRFTETLGLQSQISDVSLVKRLLFSTMPLQGASNQHVVHWNERARYFVFGCDGIALCSSMWDSEGELLQAAGGGIAVIRRQITFDFNIPKIPQSWPARWHFCAFMYHIDAVLCSSICLCLSQSLFFAWHSKPVWLTPAIG